MEQTNNTAQQDQGKTIAILSYITLIGWIVAIVMHGSNKTQLGAYHIRQSLGFMIFSIALVIVFSLITFAILMAAPFIGILFSLISWLLYIGIIVLWIIGLINAINGQMKPIPIIGNLSEKMLAGIK